MMRMFGWAAVVVSGLAAAARAETPELNRQARDELASTLRRLLLQHMPEPLYEATKDWGKTTTQKVIKLPRRILTIRHDPRNDGIWRKIRVDAINPRDNLKFALDDFQSSGPGRLTFRIRVALPARVDACQEHWESGIKLYDTSIRARAVIRAALDCEATTRVEFRGFAPDFMATLKVTRAESGYEQLVCEHIAGVGGEAAELIGDVARGILRRWKPDFESQLLDRANAAIVQAGQEHAVRLNLSKLFEPRPKKGE